MTSCRKPAPAKTRATFRKLQALAERGVDGEKVAAQRKIDRLKAKFDFSDPRAAGSPDMFQGTFKRSSKARWIYTFPHAEVEVANAVKWAIESATGIECVHRDRELLAEAAPSTVNRLARLADHISRSFRTLVEQYGGLDGVGIADRGVFIMGLYDGMMNDPRQAGQPLPNRPRSSGRRRRTKKPAASPTANLHLHPYSLAVGLGKKIRLDVPLNEIAAELDSLIQPRFTNGVRLGRQGNGLNGQTISARPALAG